VVTTDQYLVPSKSGPAGTGGRCFGHVFENWKEEVANSRRVADAMGAEVIGNDNAGQMSRMGVSAQQLWCVLPTHRIGRRAEQY
jgi:hypothetical protein